MNALIGLIIAAVCVQVTNSYNESIKNQFLINNFYRLHSQQVVDATIQNQIGHVMQIVQMEIYSQKK